ncbi:hypothetical protein KKF32_04450 [Patescibacteria group bacterium]|nr:hypothetical protein [Patescibacteria group bacterium]
MNSYLKKVKQVKWKYFGSRETSLIFYSLVAESYKYMFPKLGWSDFASGWSNIYFCAHGLIIKAFGKKSDIKKSTKAIKKKLAYNPQILKTLYELTEKEIKKTQQIINPLKNIITKKNLKSKDFKHFYIQFKNSFLSFFPLQVFPLLIELSLESETQKLSDKRFINILTKWRKVSHQTEIELENLLSLFLNKGRKHLKIDFIYWTDYEVMNYFTNSKKPKASKISHRKSFYLMIRDINLNPPYKIYMGQSAKSAYKILQKLTEEKVKGSEFKGNPLVKGKVKGEVFLIRNKNDFKRLPANKIVVAKVIEMDDIKVLKNKKITAIITEEGGLTSHIAIASREFMVPLMMGVKGITSNLKSGNLLEVDATKGIIKKIKTKLFD